jgi:hypothetical protein
VIVAAALLAAGCASSSGRSEEGAQIVETGSGPQFETMQIVVRNDRPSGAASSVQVVSTTGERTLLGAVAPLDTQTFDVKLNGNWSYRLVAEAAGGGRVVSQLFPVSEGGRVSWRLPDNFLSGP